MYLYIGRKDWQFMSVKILKEDIKNNKYKRLYVFYGQEEYLKDYYLRSIEEAILNEQTKVLNKVVLEGKLDTLKLVDYCNTQPVFADKKIVIVKNSGIFRPKKNAGGSTKKKKPEDNMLVECMESIPEHTCLIFIEVSIDTRLKLVQTVAKNGLLVDFSYQKPEELAKWAVKVFKGSNKNIDIFLASQLVENCDQGMNEILNEINKVIMYVGDRQQILTGDIDAVCTKSIKSKIFDLTDAISEKKCEKALKLLDDMVVLREPLPIIFYMIARQFRQILQMKLLTNEGEHPGDASKKIGIPPFAASKVSKQAKNFSVDELRLVINKCLEMDIAIKNGKIKDRLAADLLVTEISS